MEKYIIAPPAGSQTNALGAKDRPWEEVHANRYPGINEYLAESTGYGIVSGCEPSISGLTVTVGAGVIHLADGTRKEIVQTNITLDNADPTKPRIDLVYIDSTGTVAKITGTAANPPSVPALPSNGISIGAFRSGAGGTTATILYNSDILPRWYNSGVISVADYGAKGDGVTDDTVAIQTAINAAIQAKKLLTAKAGAVYAVSSPINIKGLLFSDWNTATLKAIDSVTSVLNLDDNYRYQPWYGSVERLQIDCNSMADCGLLITQGTKKVVRDIIVKNVNGIGIKHTGGYEVLGDNWQVEGDGVSKQSIGVMFTGDSYYHNIIVIDCYTAVSGSTSTSRVENLHAWIKTPALYEGSTFWHVPWDGHVYASHLYSDTYEYNLRFEGTAAHTYIEDLEILYNGAIVPAEKANDTVYFLYFDNQGGKLYTRDIILNGVVYAEVPANKKFTNIEGFCGEVYQFHRKNVYSPLVTLPRSIYNVNADNLLLNSNFAIAQRGTSQTRLGINSLDKWGLNGNVAAVTMERANCALTGVQYENKISLDISGSGNWCELRQVVENGINAIIDMPVTVSFWVKCSTTAQVSVRLRQVGDSENQIGSLDESIGTTWHYVEKTFYHNNPPFTPTQPHLQLAIGLLNSGTYEIANVKMEVNKKASRYNPPNETAEIIKCQRYFQSHTLYYYGDFAIGDSHDNCAYLPTFNFPKMYTTPRVTFQPSSEKFGVVESNQPSQGVGWLTSDCTLSAARVTASSFAPKLQSASYSFENKGYKALMEGVRIVWLSVDL